MCYKINYFSRHHKTSGHKHAGNTVKKYGFPRHNNPVKTALVTKNCCNFAKRLIIREKNHVKAV